MVTYRNCKRDRPHYFGDDHEGVILENGLTALPLLKEQGGECWGQSTVEKIDRRTTHTRLQSSQWVTLSASIFLTLLCSVIRVADPGCDR